MGGGKQIMSKVLQRNRSKRGELNATKSAGAPTPRVDFESDESGRSAPGGGGGSGGSGSAGGAGGENEKVQFAIKGGAIFRVNPRYKFKKAIGGGAYGVVCSAEDSKTGKMVAIKKVAGLFDDLTDAKRILREVRLLRNMSHDNVLSIMDIDKPEDYHRFDDLYIITQLMDTDMAKLIKSKSVVMQESQRRFFIYQILKAMKYIHSGNILHRDLKPANILVNENCDVKVCDFGLARWIEPDAEDNEKMTQYVVTRWYRAPELLLDNQTYSGKVDMWAVGCIVAELYSRHPMFRGNGVQHQLREIAAYLGRGKDFEWVENRLAKQFMETLPVEPTREFRPCLKDCPDDAFDFIMKLLVLNPEHRMSAEQAIGHPFVAKFRNPSTEKTADKSKLQGLDLEPPSERDIGASGVRKLTWQEVLHFHPDSASSK